MAASDGRSRIALVGFPPELRDLLTEWLSEEGYSVSSLDPGLSATSGGTPHLILAATDPRAESLATLDVLRIQPETAAIPVIVLSTSAAQQDQAQALGNVYATLSMPFESLTCWTPSVGRWPTRSSRRAFTRCPRRENPAQS